MWQEKVNSVMASSGSRRADGKVASERTQTLTKEVVYAAIRQLHEIGYKIQDPKNIGERHVDALVKHWWYCKHKKIKTIQNEVSRLRVFFGKLGKPGMVGPVQKYLPEVDPRLLKVTAAATKTKSWSGKNIDLVTKFQEVDKRDSRFGLMLRLELGFGLRREEVLKCMPHAQDFGHYLQVFPGMGKGGRWRNIPITSSAQRELLDHVKARVAKNETLGWAYSEAGKAVTLEQNIRRYENLMSSLGFTKADAGVTGHGLRAQFAENHALILGLMPPTVATGPGTLIGGAADVVKVKLAQALGHNRPSVTSAYIGSFKSSAHGEVDGPLFETIKKALRLCEVLGFPSVPVERVSDCLLIRATMAAHGTDLSEEQIHALWAQHSRRNGVEWMTPESEILLALNASASIIVGKFGL